MKFILITLFFVSCAQDQFTKPSQKTANKYDYLQEFYKTRDLMNVETDTCKSYMKNIITPKISNNSIHTITSKEYKPELFDWEKKALLKNLFLNYPYNPNIITEHLDISSNIKECMNDFEIILFLNTLAIQTSKDSQLKKTAFSVLQKHILYLNNTEKTTLVVLSTASILSTFEKENIILFLNKKEFNQKFKEINKRNSTLSKEALEYNRSKQYKKLYEVYKKLRAIKRNYKDYLVNSFRYFE